MAPTNQNMSRKAKEQSLKLIVDCHVIYNTILSIWNKEWTYEITQMSNANSGISITVIQHLGRCLRIV
ncbi:hypothetical protein VIBNISOn1_190031 [Vibrio nigripulchritudo SOn1]|uniref:Uncharacterized protein n=1 Tax=Vibrio nigripulchritudo SOn1 TaxID=1238450 RepID=A0AAV2VQ30_9VIBR|nr:hypothetical protein VIBNISOn1_190031 [Vibrio nigripulchritudo SOn1]